MLKGANSSTNSRAKSLALYWLEGPVTSAVLLRIAKIAQKGGLPLKITTVLGLMLLMVAAPAFGQGTFSDLVSYCTAAAEASTPTLLARTQNVPRSQAEALVQVMTDPTSIRMVNEVIAFAYSRPPGIPIEVLRTDLREECLARRIFVQ